MARKNKYKINGQVVNDDTVFANDDIFFNEGEEFLDEENRENTFIAAEPYPDDFDEDEFFEEAETSEVKKKKKRKKTRKEKLRYRGKYELLPERENWRQIKFYRRRFLAIGASFITGIFALLLGFAAYKYNALFGVLTILIAVPGLIYSLIGLVKIRTKGIIVVIIGLVFNIIGLIMIISPLKTIFSNFGAIQQALKDLLDLFI